MRRIVVVGTSGSGKTTLARQLAACLNYAHIEIDALNWGPNWQESTKEELQSRVAEATQGECWVIDGNYSRVRDLVWSRADTIVWLDYPFRIVFTRILRRTFKRTLFREKLWNDNRETFWKLFTRDSIIWWVIKTYRRRRREYPQLFQQPEYRHLTVIQMPSPKATRKWLTQFRKDP